MICAARLRKADGLFCRLLLGENYVTTQRR